MIAHKIEGTSLYQNLPKEMQSLSHEVKPLNEEPKNRITDFPEFETWQSRRSKA
jgi:hypothetical protein